VTGIFGLLAPVSQPTVDAPHETVDRVTADLRWLTAFEVEAHTKNDKSLEY